jgi:C4-dicarboxylate-specific signal transduction histidine kinase
MKRFRIDFRSLPAQMILSFIALVLLTAAATGLPAIWLIRDQLERQAWDQVEHGSRAAQALYAAQQNEITSLATLTAQRPTLRDLLMRGDLASMQSYLGTLQTGAELDLVLICEPGGQITAQAGSVFPDMLCKANVFPGFHVVSAEGTSEVWAITPLSNKET